MLNGFLVFLLLLPHILLEGKNMNKYEMQKCCFIYSAGVLLFILSTCYKSWNLCNIISRGMIYEKICLGPLICLVLFYLQVNSRTNKNYAVYLNIARYKYFYKNQGLGPQQQLKSRYFRSSINILSFTIISNIANQQFLWCKTFNPSL